jgi:hypothetical protein
MRAAPPHRERCDDPLFTLPPALAESQAQLHRQLALLTDFWNTPTWS